LGGLFVTVLSIFNGYTQGVTCQNKFKGYNQGVKASPTTGPEPLAVADHPALDLLNTVAMVDGEPVDFLQGDGDVVRWLARARGGARGTRFQGRPGTLLAAARTLRETIRSLVARRKNGQKAPAVLAEAAVLNRFLAEAGSRPELVWDDAGGPRLERRRDSRTPEQLLAPLAESAAELLSAADFDLVRPCAGPGCVLWFYDRTKSHRRRWCSMAVCGNRHKVAAFRQRQGE
jgi:predicted RNA-binding Zn ribbon-like protein